MTTQAYRLSIEVMADKAKQGLDKLKSSFDGLEKETRETEKAIDSVNNKSQALGNAFGMLKGALGALGLGMTIGSIIQTADTMQVLSDQIKLATGTTEKFGVAMQNIERIAMDNKVSLQSVGEMYVSNERALKQIGKTQEEVLRFTENVTKAMAVGGGSAQGQAAALTQLGQAMASGVLRGDEFNSIAEQAPMIMTLMADSLKVTTGELRKMAADGKLTADVVYKALTNAEATTKLKSMSGATATTVSQAMQQVSNQWDIAVHKIMNGEGGISQSLAGMISGFAEVIPKVLEFGEAFAQSDTGKAIIEGLGTAFDTLKGAVSGIGEFLTPIGDFLANNTDLVVSMTAGLAAGATAYYAITAAMGLFTTVSTAAAAAGGMAALATTALGTAIAFVTSPVTIAVASIAALVAGGVWLYQNWDMIKAKASEVWNSVKSTISETWEGIKAWFSGNGDLLADTWQKVKDGVSNAWDSIKTAVQAKFEEIKQAFFDWLGGMPQPVQDMVANIGSIFGGIGSIFGGVATVASNAWGGIKNVASEVASSVSDKWTSIKDSASEAWQGVKATASEAWGGLKNVAGEAWQGVKSKVSESVGAIENVIEQSGIKEAVSNGFERAKNVATNVLNALKNAAKFAMDSIKAIFTAGVTIFASVFNAGFNLVKNVFMTAFNVIKALVRGDIQGVRTAIQTGLQNAVSIVKTMVSNIVGAFKDLGNRLLQAGKDAIQGFINGVKGKMGEALNTAREMAGKVVNVVKSALDIHSPSRVMKKLGGHTAEGMAEGIKKDTPKAVKAAQKMAEDAKKAVADAVASLKRDIALFGDDSPIKALEYDIKDGKYGKENTKELETLTAQRYQLELNKSVQDDINRIKHDSAMLGMDELERLHYEVEVMQKYKGANKELVQDYLKRATLLKEETKAYDNTKSVTDAIKDIDEKILLIGKDNLQILEHELATSEKYAGVSDEIKKSYLERATLLERETKAYERTQALAKSQLDLEKQVYLFNNTKDKYAEQRWDLKHQGYSDDEITQMVGKSQKQDVLSNFAKLQNEIQNKSVFKLPDINGDFGQVAQDAFGSWAKLEEDYNAKLEQIKEARQSGLDIHADYNEQELELQQQYESAKIALTQSTAMATVGSIANFAKSALGEQSKAYQAMFRLQQSFVIGSAILNIHKAISDAFAEGKTLAQKFAGIATATTEGMKIVSAIRQIQNPTGKGFKTGGYTGNYGKNQVAGMVHGQEYVLNAKATKQIGVNNLNRLNNGEGIGGNNIINVTVTVNSDGGNVKADEMMGKRFGEAINSAVQKALHNERRQGGLLYG